MKFIFSVSLILLIFLGCRKKDITIDIQTTYELTQHWGNVNFLISGKNADTIGFLEKRHVTKIAALYKDSVYGIVIRRFTDDKSNYLRESIGFSNLKYPPNKGVYPMGGNDQNPKSSFENIKRLAFSQYWLYSSDSDVLAGKYVLNNEKNSFLEITDYNDKTGELKGIFEAHYKIELKGLQGLPDTFSITKGVFYTKFYKF